MGKQADYIKRIEIDALWGRLSVSWDLRPDVNILSGINGIGKSTILNTSVGMLTDGVEKGVKITFEPEDADSIPFDVIRSFDRPLLHSELLDKMADKNVKTEPDWQLYQLQRRYLDYQVNIGNRIIELLTEDTDEAKAKAAQVSIPKRKFQDLVDELFKDTHKKIDRKSNEILFIQRGGETLSPYQLSSGEKQMIVILLTVLVQDNKHCTLFMDEPEVSLHVEWQQKLISIIRELNPNVQIILTTHSPAVIMNGWLDAVTEVSDISSNK